MLYATKDQFKTRIALVTSDEAVNTLIEDLLEEASRAVEDYLDVSLDYFAPVIGNSVKTILGRGTSYIILPAPLSGTVTITAPTGFVVPNFKVEELKLITLTEEGFPSPFVTWDAVYYTVSGVWGVASVPAQIRGATLGLAIHFFKNRDKNLSGTITNMGQDEQYPERDYPRAVRRILDEYKARLGAKPGGGLYIA